MAVSPPISRKMEPFNSEMRLDHCVVIKMAETGKYMGSRML